MSFLLNALVLFTVVVLILLVRLISILPKFQCRKPEKRKRGTASHLMVVLGSGGHTAEMLLILRDLDTSSYTFRRYVVSSSDNFSAQRAIEFERTLQSEATKRGKPYGGFDVQIVHRARNVHQSLFTTPLSALKCTIDCLKTLRVSPKSSDFDNNFRSPYPDLIMANGPATATIMIFASLIVRFLGVPGSNGKMRCIYVESWARVKTPSLSAKILSLAGVCDRLLVQWATLANRGFEFRGQLVS